MLDTKPIFAKQYYANLIVVFKGNYLKFGWMKPNKKKNRSESSSEYQFEKTNGEYFQDIACKFTADTEIIQLIETA